MDGSVSTGSPAWWRGAVIYQIYLRSFCDTNGDGIGDLPGVLARLDYLARLGVDAVWLTPFFPSPMRDFGYDVANYTDVDPVYGTLADFDAVLARAHGLGLKVFIEQVWSHTSDEHPWFTVSRQDRTNGHADWYIWADPRPDGTAPNNWLAVFGGAAWTWEPRRRQYYLHHFLSAQPALNLRHPAVEQALFEAARFWLDRGVDGFRLDAVDWMFHSPSLADNPPAPPGPIPTKPFAMQLHQHDLMHGDTLGFLERIRKLMNAYPGTATLGELSSQEGAFARVRAYTQPHRLDMAYTLKFMRGALSAETLRHALSDEPSSDHPGWPCWAFSNHDTERAISRWNPRATSGEEPPEAFGRLLAGLLISLRGSVCLYQGEDLALPEARLAYADLQDPFGLTYWPTFAGRDGGRTPMPWEAGEPGVGFTDGKAWLPVPEEHRRRAAGTQELQPTSALRMWRHALAFRKAHPALIHGELTWLDGDGPLVAWIRSTGEEQLMCVFNLTDAPAGFEVAQAVRQIWMPLEAASPPDPTAGTWTVPPYGVMFLALA